MVRKVSEEEVKEFMKKVQSLTAVSYNAGLGPQFLHNISYSDATAWRTSVQAFAVWVVGRKLTGEELLAISKSLGIGDSLMKGTKHHTPN